MIHSAFKSLLKAVYAHLVNPIDAARHDLTYNFTQGGDDFVEGLIKQLGIKKGVLKIPIDFEVGTGSVQWDSSKDCYV